MSEEKMTTEQARAAILYNKGDATAARTVANEVVAIARERDLKTRLVEAETFLELF
ncbi:hypothetical protein HYW61_01700 [candidate division WWE3 bacterium]|nr:hypothetical protein [candidate division WWE3 bacterium]